MLKQLIKFYQISTPAPVLKENKKKLKKLQWATFFSATAGYGIYYVCRLSLNVVKSRLSKKVYFQKPNSVSLVPCCFSHMPSENSPMDF